MPKILVLPGDGVGPSVIRSATDIMNVAADGLEFVEGEIGFSAYESSGQYLPYETLDLVEECPVVMSGPVRPIKDERGGVKDPLQILKTQLDLYALVKCFRTISDDLGIDGVDITLWCSNTSIGQDVQENRDMDGITLNKYVRSSSYSRMMAKALSDIEMSGCRKVACITRSDLFPESSAMFRESFDSLFDTGDIDIEHIDIQRWASLIVRNPHMYETVVCADLYGHVAAGILAGMTGGNHLSPNGFVGDNTILFEPGHIHMFDDVPKGYENPTSAIIAASMALNNLGMRKEGQAVFEAVSDAYRAGERTPDVGGTMSLAEFTDAVIRRI